MSSHFRNPKRRGGPSNWVALCRMIMPGRPYRGSRTHHGGKSDPSDWMIKCRMMCQATPTVGRGHTMRVGATHPIG
jgi:hypothetical protein